MPTRRCLEQSLSSVSPQALAADKGEEGKPTKWPLRLLRIALLGRAEKLLRNLVKLHSILSG